MRLLCFSLSAAPVLSNAASLCLVHLSLVLLVEVDSGVERVLLARVLVPTLAVSATLLLTMLHVVLRVVLRLHETHFPFFLFLSLSQILIQVYIYIYIYIFWNLLCLCVSEPHTHTLNATPRDEAMGLRREGGRERQDSLFIYENVKMKRGRDGWR